MSPIIPIEMIQAKAQAAYYRGVPRDGHEFNWHAEDAIAVWQAEWDKCDRQESCAFFRRQAEVVVAEAA